MPCPHPLAIKFPLSCAFVSLELRALAHMIKNSEGRTVSTPCCLSAPQRHHSPYPLLYQPSCLLVYPPLFTSHPSFQEYVLHYVLWSGARLSHFIVSIWNDVCTLMVSISSPRAPVWSSLVQAPHLCLLMLPLAYLVIPAPLDLIIQVISLNCKALFSTTFWRPKMKSNSPF